MVVEAVPYLTKHKLQLKKELDVRLEFDQKSSGTRGCFKSVRVSACLSKVCDFKRTTWSIKRNEIGQVAEEK